MFRAVCVCGPAGDGAERGEGEQRGPEGSAGGAGGETTLPAGAGGGAGDAAQTGGGSEDGVFPIVSVCVCGSLAFFSLCLCFTYEAGGHIQLLHPCECQALFLPWDLCRL